MDKISTEKLNRRQFIKKIGRYSLLSGLGTLGLFLGFKREVSNSKIKRTFLFSQCRSCKQIDKCQISKKKPSEIETHNTNCINKKTERVDK